MFSGQILQQIFLAILGISFLIQAFYLLFVHLKLSFYSDKKSKANVKHPFSVIVYARNEADNLKAHLTDILEQDYIQFEVIVVNDASWDDTEDVLRAFLAKYSRLKVVNVPEQERFKWNKKFALTMGIKAAQYEYLLFTEANCKVLSKKWIKQIAAQFNNHTELVLGYALIEKTPGFLNLFYRYVNFVNILNYLSFAIKGGAYKADGRNIAYLKSVFFRGKGFASHMHVPFGEDMLFVNQHATSANVSVIVGATVSYAPNGRVGQFVKQRIREMQVSRLFKGIDRFKIKLKSVADILFYASIISLAALHFNWKILLAVYFMRLLTQYLVYLKAFKKLHSPQLKWFLPFLDIFYSLYALLLSSAFLFKNKSQWK